jgi:DNA (cytosine-5)-methyltransferase 1
MTQLGIFDAPATRDPFLYTPPPRVAELGEIIVDSFAGGGGASEGIRLALGVSPHIGINHKFSAIAMHAANHPETEHYTENVWKVDPVAACKGRPVGLMWLSPDCTHFSKAKGKKPLSNKRRGLAWVAIRWASTVRPRVMILENVEEFEQWGPLDRKTERPCPKRKGQTFRAFVRKLQRFGYVVEWRQLRGCDYGTPELGVPAAPTTRKRLFLIARCDGQPIVWPTPTHGPGRAFPHRTAAECIDWSIPCPSIFITKRQATQLRKKYGIVVKRPLVVKTKRRIARGVFKFVINNPGPYIVPMYHGNRPTSIDEPLQTITTQGNKFNLVVPFVAGVGGRMGQSPERPVDGPFQTLTSKADAAIVMPFIARAAHGEVDRNGKRRGQPAHPITEPLGTVMASGEFSLLAPFLVPRYGEDPNRNDGAGQAPRSNSIEAPMPTIVPTQNGAQLVSAFMAKHFTDRGQRPGSDLSEPLSTITASDHNALVSLHLQRDFGKSIGSPASEPVPTITGGGGGHAALVASSLVKLKGTAKDGQPIDEPIHTIQAHGNHYAQVCAFLTKYHGAARSGHDLFSPLRTVDTRDRFALVTVSGQDYVIVDIGMRMLVPRELFRAQGFRDSYIIDVEIEVKQKRRRKGRIYYVTKRRMLTKEEQTDMVGNSVNPTLACALVHANYVPVSVPRERVA